MRNFSFSGTLAVALLALAALPAQAQTQDDFFDDSYVHEMRLIVKASDWAAAPQDRFDENTYYDAEVHWIFKGNRHHHQGRRHSFARPWQPQPHQTQPARRYQPQYGRPAIPGSRLLHPQGQ